MGSCSRRTIGLTPAWHRRTLIAAARAILCGMIVLAAPLSTDSANAQGADTKPYDDQLMRLSEILGAMHFLRELCSANDGTLWRDKMQKVLEVEGATALRRARLSRSFNKGYESYRRTYVTCTRTAQSSIARFLAEGVKLSETLFKTAP